MLRRLRSRARVFLAILAVVVAALAWELVVPQSAAALPLVGHLDLLSPVENAGGDLGARMAGPLFQFIFKTFFGVQAKVTRAVVEFLCASPIFTDGSRYPNLVRLETYVTAGSWGILTLMFTGSALRYWAAGFTSSSSYDALTALWRSIAAVGILIVHPIVFGQVLVAGNMLTHAILNAPGIEKGLNDVFISALAMHFTSLGLASIADAAGVLGLIVLAITKIVLSSVLAVLFVSAPLAIAFFPLSETAWLTRMWAQSLFAVMLWPVVWSLCFAVFAVMGKEAFSLHGSFGDNVIKPWVTVAALIVAYKAPQLVARQAMLAGLAPRVGNWAGRALIYGSATTRLMGRAGSGGAGGAGGAGSGVNPNQLKLPISGGGASAGAAAAAG